MTTLDPFNHPDMGKKVDAESAASALGEIFQLLASPSTTTSDPLTAIPKQPQSADQSITPTTTATGTTGAETASPVPQGTTTSQGYGGEGGHPGIDLAVPLNTQLLAAASGQVTHASNDDPGGYGEWVEITTPEGIALRYGHLHGTNVKVGDTVRAGQIIGSSGGEAGGPTSGNSKGAHLHFEVRTQGHTIDPTPFLAGGYQIIGGNTGDMSTPTTADPRTLANLAVKNVVRALSGQPLLDDTTNQSTTQDSTSTSDTDPAAVTSFLNATKQHESGGNYTIRNQSGQSNAAGAYQFLGSTWRGLGGSTASAAEASPAEQDTIARKYALQLFDQFHSWKLVAAAWYGGPGIAAQIASGQNPGSPQGQGSYVDYMNKIASMMQGGGR